MQNLSKLSSRISTISDVLTKQGLPEYQLKNTLNSIYKKNTTKFSDLTYLPAKTRDALIGAFNGQDQIISSTLSPSLSTPSDQCQKLLFHLTSDKSSIESVWMQFRNSKHFSVCISSQVGCSLKKMACTFCATGAAGFKRQLTTDEIVDQVLYFLHDGRKVDTISFMGMGEALQNPRVFDALTMLTDDNTFGLSQRRINVSTVGVIPGIRRLTRDFPRVNLAFSLHSPFDEQRSELVPINKMYPLTENLEALKDHALATKRRVLIAYLVLPEYNSSVEHAQELANIIKTMPPSIRRLFHVNLLRYNPAEGVAKSFRRTGKKHLEEFAAVLDKHRITYTIRQSFGLDIDAACGQLYQVSKNALKKVDKLNGFI